MEQEEMSIALYNNLKQIIFEPARNDIRNARNYLLQYNDIDMEDIIQELYLKLPQTLKFTLSDEWVYNALRQLLNERKRRPQEVSLDYLIEIGFDYSENELFKQECSDDDADCYNTILCYAIFDDIDIAVLTGEITRKEAAAALGIEYEAYKKRLQRKKYKINVPENGIL